MPILMKRFFLVKLYYICTTMATDKNERKLNSFGQKSFSYHSAVYKSYKRNTQQCWWWVKWLTCGRKCMYVVCSSYFRWREYYVCSLVLGVQWVGRVRCNLNHFFFDTECNFSFLLQLICCLHFILFGQIFVYCWLCQLVFETFTKKKVVIVQFVYKLIAIVIFFAINDFFYR